MLTSTGRRPLHYQAPAPSMRHLIPLLVLAAAVGAAFLGFSRLSYGLLLPAIRHDLSGSYGAYGVIGSANLAGYLVGTLSLPLLLARVGDRLRLNVVWLTVMVLSLAGAATSTDLQQLAAWRFVNGVACGPATVLTIALVLERVPLPRRGAASGLVWTGGAAGVAISGLAGPLVAGAPQLHLWRPVWIGMAVAGLAAALGMSHALRRTAPVPAVTHGPGGGARARLWRPPLVWLPAAYLLFGAGYIIYFTFVVALLVRQGAPAPLTSFAWVLLGAAGALGASAWGRVSDGRAGGFALAVALGSSALGGLSVLTGSIGAELVGAVLIGSGAFGVPSVMTARLRRAITDDRQYTSSLSVITAVFAIGQVIGPLMAGWLIDVASLAAGTALSGAVLLAAAAVATAYGAAAGTR